jgi:hypothetical protein
MLKEKKKGEVKDEEYEMMLEWRKRSVMQKKREQEPFLSLANDPTSHIDMCGATVNFYFFFDIAFLSQLYSHSPSRLKEAHIRMSTLVPPATTNSLPTAPTADAKKSNNNNRNRGPRGDSPTVRLSKALSWLLRHNAVSQGIAIRPDGYVKLTAVLGHPKFKDFTLDDIVHVVDSNEKKRFEILEDAQGEKEYIRAVQGHSITAVSILCLRFTAIV